MCSLVATCTKMERLDGRIRDPAVRGVLGALLPHASPLLGSWGGFLPLLLCGVLNSSAAAGEAFWLRATTAQAAKVDQEPVSMTEAPCPGLPAPPRVSHILDLAPPSHPCSHLLWRLGKEKRYGLRYYSASIFSVTRGDQ